MRLPKWIEHLPPFRGRRDGQTVTFAVRPRWHRYRGMEFAGTPCLDCGLHPDSMIHDEAYREDAALVTVTR